MDTQRPLVAVIGSGRWGQAAATLAALRGPVLLWGRNVDKMQRLAATRQSDELRLRMPDAVECSHDPAQLRRASVLLWAVPTQHTRATLESLQAHLLPGAPLVSLSKGLEQSTLLRVSEVFAQVLTRETVPRPLGSLSGPALADEVAAGKPTGLVVAGSEQLCAQVTQALHSPRLRVYSSSDLLGVELGGALKNVIAIPAGICDGLDVGNNLKATLLTRGLTEMRRLGRALGANDATFAGLAGIGDMLTTCYAPSSRNRGLGEHLARKGTLAAWLAAGKGVAEGAWTSRAAVELAVRVGVELPIASQVASVCWHDTPLTSALEQLLAREPKEEDA